MALHVLSAGRTLHRPESPMPDAQYPIRSATAGVAMRQAFAVFVRGPLRPHADALESWLRLVFESPLGPRLGRYRQGGDASWRSLGDPAACPDLAELLGLRGSLAGAWRAELADDQYVAAPATGICLEIDDLAVVRGLERASYLRFLFDESVTNVSVAALAEWVVKYLPFWWGSAGYVFHHTTGKSHTAAVRMAALAKRYWGVQIQDLTALQWDALSGMSGVSWLTLVGEGFARQHGMSLDSVAPATSSRLHFRRGQHGLVLAAGPKPLLGDVNTDEDFDAYFESARLLQPLLLTRHTPLAGPFAQPGFLAAWLNRFLDPKGWQEIEPDLA